MIVSIDVPSGLNADTGEAEGNAVCADLTLTMGMPKRGLLQPAALNYVGSVDVADIGLPDELTAEIQSDIEMITVEDVRHMLPRRTRTAHKGMFGHVLIIGGARSYSGAVAMAAQAALRSGAGLVSVLAPTSIASIVATIVPEAMVRGQLHRDPAPQDQ
jgi:NAD(P)H-hydrate epimerase